MADRVRRQRPLVADEWHQHSRQDQRSPHRPADRARPQRHRGRDRCAQGREGAATMTQIESGIWRHWKGNLYQMLGIARDANAGELTIANSQEHWDEDNFRSIPLGERTVVVYIGLQLDGATPGPRMNVRTLEDFIAWVPTSDTEGQARMIAARSPGDPLGYYVRHTDTGYEIPRFEYLGPELTEHML